VFYGGEIVHVSTKGIVCNKIDSQYIVMILVPFNMIRNYKYKIEIINLLFLLLIITC
jgi:hypothetical protein